MSEALAALGSSVAQLVILLAVAPLIHGVIKRAKAALQGRHGPPLLQPYFDLRKLLRKDEVISEHATAVSRWAPAVYAAAIMAAALLVPLAGSLAPLGGAGDAIALIGLFALARFAIAIAALDTASPFGAIGASRDVAVAALAEPALLLGVFAVAWRSGGTDLGATSAWVMAHGPAAFAPSQLLGLGAIFIAVIAETGRIPADNADTHLELTMIHEGMLLERSGRPLGVLQWAGQLKQVVLFSLVIALFVPYGAAASPQEVPLAIAAFVAKLALLGLVIAVVESSSAKMRILRLPELLGAATALGALAILAEVVIG